MMHGCGKMGTTPASDVAMHERRCCSHVSALSSLFVFFCFFVLFCFVFFFFFWFFFFCFVLFFFFVFVFVFCFFCFFFFLFLATRRLGLICAKSVCIGQNCRNTLIQAVPAPNPLIQAEIQKKKKKKRVQNAPFELHNKTLNYLSSQLNSFFNFQLSLTLCAPQSPHSSLLSVSLLSQTHSVTP